MRAIRTFPADAAAYAEVAGLVAERSGMVFAPNRQVEAEAGIGRGMRHVGAANLAAYVDVLRSDGAALDHLVDELTVGETHFMRDPTQMSLLRDDILPALLRRRGRGPARLWSAGCATGEEAYSLAILLEQAGFGESASVLGTDLSVPALARARVASYSSWSMRGVDAAFLASYFLPQRGRSLLVDRIRGKVRFERLNLVGDASYTSVGAGGMDLILCRNVLIYFDHATAGRIAGRLFDSLAEGGVLLTAGADPFLAADAPFDVEVTRAGLVYRRPWRRLGMTSAAEPARPRVTTEAAVREERAPAGVPAPAPAADAAVGDAACARIEAAANEHGDEEAERLARGALALHPLHAPLHHLRATLLLALGRADDAEESAQRALYLDRSLAAGHFLLGTIQGRRGATDAARRSFRNARNLSAALPPGQLVAGERAEGLAAAADSELARLEVVEHE